MKNLIAVFTLLLFGLAQVSLAQQAKDYKGHLIDAKGDVYFDGIKTGYITKDSLIKDAKGKQIGFINANGSVSDANGKQMGKMGKDGKTYYNSFGVVAFKVQDIDGETCNILDAKGKKIGNVHDSYKGMSCALHCFQNEMDMKKHSKTNH